MGLVAATMCMSFPQNTNVNTLIAQATTHSNNNVIDNVSNLRGDPVFIFHGTSDSTVLPGQLFELTQCTDKHEIEILISN